MASGRLRIGHSSAAARTMLAEYGQYNLNGQTAQLTHVPLLAGEYDNIDNPVGYTDLWVDPEKATNGDGSLGNMYQFSQVMSHPSPSAKRFIVIPGRLSVTAVNANSKFPALFPVNSGTQSQPAILKAQFPATRASTTEAQMTIIDRTSGAGSIIGTYSSGGDHWRLDGFKFEGTHGGGGNENAHIVLRNRTGWWITRTWIDDNFESFVPFIGCPGTGCNDGSTNGGGIFIQGTTFCKVRDVLIENLGQVGGGNLIVWQPIELYDTTDFEASYFTIRNVWGIGVHMKGEQFGPAFRRNYIHHGVVDNCRDSGCNPLFVRAGTNPADHNRWWNIIVSNCDNHGSEWNMIGPDPHTGTHFRNMTYVNNGGSNVMFRGGTDTQIAYSQHCSIKNSVFRGTPKHLEFLDHFYPGDTTFWGLDNEEIQLDYNRYNNATNIAEAANGSSSTLSAWRSRTDTAKPPNGWDDNSDDTVHTYEDFLGGDYHTAGSVPADRPDDLGVYGTVGALVPPGAWERGGYRDNV